MPESAEINSGETGAMPPMPVIEPPVQPPPMPGDPLTQIPDAVPPAPAVDPPPLPAEPLTMMPPQAAPAESPMETTEATETIVPIIPALPAGEAAEDNLFFDADALVPQGEMGVKGGPNKVNPVTQPGSKLVIVTKEASADSPRATLVSAQRAMQLGRYDSALEIYETMLQKSRKDPNALLGRAIALQRLGRDEAAVSAYGDLLDIQPENMDAKVNMYGLVGKRYPAVALQQLLTLWDRNQSNVGIIAQIAVIQANLGRYGDALKSLGIAASLEPSSPAHIFNMAVISDKGGNKKDAVALYEKALDLDTMTGARAIPREAIFDRLAALR